MKKILLIYVSRSFSTLFMRIMMNADAKVYHDRLGGSIRFPGEDYTPETVTDFYVEEAKRNAASSLHTFVKESCWVFEHNERCLRKMLDENGFIPVFLVRNPKDALSSYLKMERGAGDDKWTTGRSIRHDLLHRFYKEYGGLLIIAEDFISRPKETMSEVFDHLGLPFSERILELQPLPVNALDESKILKNYQQFYGQTLKSDRIIDKTVVKQEFDITDPLLLESIERNMAYYRLLLEEKQRMRVSI